MKDEFKATMVVDLDPEAVWEALTSRTLSAEADSSSETHLVLPGFPSFTPLPVAGASCTPLELEPKRLLRVRKDHEPCAGTEIAIELVHEDKGTRITVVQSGFGPWFERARDTILAHGRQIMADFQLFLERGVIAPGTAWGVNLGLQPRELGYALEVVSVADEGPAKQAGLEVGDLLLSVRGIRLHDLQQYWTVLALSQPGTEVPLCWVRGRETLQGKAQL